MHGSRFQTTDYPHITSVNFYEQLIASLQDNTIIKYDMTNLWLNVIIKQLCTKIEYSFSY